KPLPGLIPYGPAPQGLQQNTRFTGGSVPGGSLSLTHPEAPPTFHEPQFAQAPSQALGPVPAPPPPTSRLAPMLALAALTGAIGTGGAPGPLTPPPPGHGVPQPTPSGGLSQPSSPAGAPGTSGGYAIPNPVVQAGVLANLASNPNPQYQPYNGLSALLANPAIGRRGVFKVEVRSPLALDATTSRNRR